MSKIMNRAEDSFLSVLLSNKQHQLSISFSFLKHSSEIRRSDDTIPFPFLKILSCPIRSLSLCFVSKLFIFLLLQCCRLLKCVNQVSELDQYKNTIANERHK